MSANRQAAAGDEMRTVLCSQLGDILYREISAEIDIRQATDRYLSDLYDSQVTVEAFHICSALESYRRIEWAAEMIRVHPEKSWQTFLHE